MIRLECVDTSLESVRDVAMMMMILILIFARLKRAVPMTCEHGEIDTQKTKNCSDNKASTESKDLKHAITVQELYYGAGMQGTPAARKLTPPFLALRR